MGNTKSFSLENAGSYQRYSVGSVIANKYEKERLIDCPYSKRVSTCHSKPLYLCGLAVACFGACPSSGERIRFKHLYDGYHIVWVCSKLKNLSGLEK
jgi:hypothetical protein